MDLKKIDLEALLTIAEKSKKVLESLTSLKEVSEQSKKSKTPILITKKEAATFLQVSEGHLALLRHRGTGPKFVKIGGTIYYDIPDLFDYIENCKQWSTTN